MPIIELLTGFRQNDKIAGLQDRHPLSGSNVETANCFLERLSSDAKMGQLIYLELFK